MKQQNLIRVGSYVFDPGRVVYVELRESGGAYLSLEGSEDPLVLLPAEVDQLLKIISPVQDANAAAGSL